MGQRGYRKKSETMNSTHLIITNRAAISGDWIHVVPKGELPNREAKLVQVLDDAALDSILANIAADRARLGERWPGIYAGREHFIYNDDQDSAALAWFKDFEKRDDGIWAKKDGLTPIGQQVIANSEYKFTSFVADRRDTQKLDGKAEGGQPRVRILKLDTIGFTNQANGKELLTPITNRISAAASAAADITETNQTKGKMKTVCTLLGLSAEADEASVHAAVTSLKNRATAAEAEVTPLKNRVSDLEKENTTLLDEQIAADFATAKITDEKIINRHTPLLRDAKHFKNRAERLAFIQDLAKPAEKPGPQTRVLNRGAGKPTETATEPADEQALAQKAEAEITSYRLTNRCSYGDARNAVRAQKPELFGLAK